MTTVVEHSEPGIQAEASAMRYRESCEAHWDVVAQRLDESPGWGGYYHQRLCEVYKFLIAPGQRVLELGCLEGDLLASVQPSQGVGVDLSREMIHRAKSRYPKLHFVHADVHELDLEGSFDYVILSDLVNELWDVQTVFEKVRGVCTPKTRVLINTYSRLWEKPLALAKYLNLARPVLRQNWLTVQDVSNLLYVSGFEVLRTWEEVIWPVRTPVIDAVFNRYVVRLWPFNHLALSNFVMARMFPEPVLVNREPTVSVVVPARNEAGNIESILKRTPEMGGGTELIFVEGHSKDDTYEVIEQAIAGCPERQTMLLRQPGVGKGDAVRAGFAHATGDIFMILDADMTVPPEDLPRFYEAIQSGRGDFINGVRLVYPMENEAMRFFNLVGNKFFSLAFSWLLGQPIKDSLCGTKVLWRGDYELIVANRSYFGHFDPFGDFDLLFGAAKLNLKILDMPIRYRQRLYGTTQIHRWRHGTMLLRMVAFAARRIKFI